MLNKRIIIKKVQQDLRLINTMKIIKNPDMIIQKEQEKKVRKE